VVDTHEPDAELSRATLAAAEAWARSAADRLIASVVR